jgi:hypothetical protein
MKEYRIVPEGTFVTLLSVRAMQRNGTHHPGIGWRIAFRSKRDIAEFVRIGEAEGFTFEGHEALEFRMMRFLIASRN